MTHPRRRQPPEQTYAFFNTNRVLQLRETGRTPTPEAARKVARSGALARYGVFAEI